MAKNEELLCASFIRYSSSRQRKGHSKETQSARNRYTIDHIIGGKFVEEFIDDAVSGFHDNFHKRTGMLGLLKAICEGKVNCVVFYDESRFSRRISDFFREFLAPIREENPNVKFFRSIDIDETGGKEWDPEDFEVKRNFILAYKESANKQVYAERGIALNLSKGKRPGSRLPYGIERITGHEVIPNEDIAVVLLLFELASWGYSENNIAEILSSMKIEPRFKNVIDEDDSDDKRNKIVGWNPSSVRYILNNPIYIGKAYWNRRESIYNSTPKPVEQQIEFTKYNPVIPTELWNLAHEEIERKSNRKNGAKIRMKTRYMLSDIVTCKKCDQLLKTKNSAKGSSIKTKKRRSKVLIYYYCPQCSLKIDSDELDHMILNQIKPMIINQFDPIKVTRKINEWIKIIKVTTADKERHLQLDKLNRSLDKTKRLLTPKEFNLYESIQEEYSALLEDEIFDLNRTLDELKNLKSSNVFERMQKRLSALEQDLEKIEIRYLLFRCIDSLKVSFNKDENIDIDLQLRNIPLPLLQQKLEEQIF